MFDSERTARSLINELKAEIDVAIPISDQEYVDWLNSVEQLLYTEVIKEQANCVIPYTGNILISDITGDGYTCGRFEDIYSVYAAKIAPETKYFVQLIKENPGINHVFPNTYYKLNDPPFGERIGLVVDENTDYIKIVFFAKPDLKTIENGVISDETVKIPIEFIDLIKSKIRGEAYKLANEDDIAAKWLNDYNYQLETFKAWMLAKNPNFGR